MSIESLRWPEFKTYLLSRARQKNTAQNICSLKSRFFIIKRYFDTRAFTPENFDRFLVKLIEAGYKNEYTNKFITVAKHLAKFHHRKGFEDIMRFKVEAPDYEPMTYEEMNKIANYNFPYKRGREARNKELNTIYQTLIETGARIGEVLNLKQGDVNDFTVLFTDTKTYKKRRVPISKILYRKLTSLYSPSEFVFHGFNRSHMSRISFQEDLKARARRLHIRKLKDGVRAYPWPHLFRISVATMLTKNGMHILDIMNILGHQSADTTARYAKTDMAHLKRQIERYHPSFARTYTLEEISDLLVKNVKNLLNPKYYSYIIQCQKNVLAIKIKRV